MRLLIARHGNTFSGDETPRRIGQKTDLPLVESGLQQAATLGQYLQTQQLIPDVIYCSELQRTQQTAAKITKIINQNIPIIHHAIFNEVDYGIDENQPEDKIIARIGQAALTAWDKSATVPPGWHINPQQICQQWQNFASDLVANQHHHTVLVVTSNGIARFAPCLTANPDEFEQNHQRKIATGALCQLYYQAPYWAVKFWGIRPSFSNVL